MYWLITAEELNEIPLRASVERFLSSPPSNAMDQELLVIVLKFIAEHSLILRHHLTWLPSLLCDERNALSKLVVSHIGNDSTLTKVHEIFFSLSFPLKIVLHYSESLSPKYCGAVK